VATRVHLIEPGWNPAIERQALDRVHRLGQTRPVKQIRYVVERPDSVERVSTYLLFALRTPRPPSPYTRAGSGLTRRVSLVYAAKAGMEERAH
jgi:hypothetical protein